MKFTVSARGKPANKPIKAFLGSSYSFPLDQIESIFGFVERCTLYGGRRFQGPQFTDSDVDWMYGNGIGLRIPLTNHYVEREEYESYSWFFEKYHKKGNSIICTNDKLAHFVREDFPNYQLEASIIKNIDTYEKIEEALVLYDTVVLPTHSNNELEFLEKVPSKSRITLFAWAGCGVNCKSKICYPSISKINKFNGYSELKCSLEIKERERLGRVFFDLDKYLEMGFSRFKCPRP